MESQEFLEKIVGYLPYGLKVLRPDNKTVLEVKGINGNLFVFNESPETYGAIRINTNKLILRPLSDLTKEIEVNGDKFVPAKILKFDKSQYYLLKNPIGYDIHYSSFVKLFEWHFDIFRLIEKGLAIDINTL